MGLIGGLIAACFLIICALYAAKIATRLDLQRKLKKEAEARAAGKEGAILSYAPWSHEQITQLNAYQMNQHFHAFTCPNRGNGKHPEINGEKGRLLATPYGWVCNHCDYKQNWAHAFMTRKMVA